jgi:hypothetical protein
MTASEIDLKRKNCKKIENKNDIKSLAIKNTIKEIDMTDLNLTNKEAL